MRNMIMVLLILVSILFADDHADRYRCGYIIKYVIGCTEYIVTVSDYSTEGDKLVLIYFDIILDENDNEIEVEDICVVKSDNYSIEPDYCQDEE